MRVAGKFWHTHSLCNPYYTAYFTKPHKDRLSVLEVLQNTEDLKFLLNSDTLRLLEQPHHREQMAAFQICFWDYYRKLLVYGLSPSADSAERLRAEFDELFSTKTRYTDLD